MIEYLIDISTCRIEQISTINFSFFFFFYQTENNDNYIIKFLYSMLNVLHELLSMLNYFLFFKDFS